MMPDSQETLLQARCDSACSALAAATKIATQAVRARNKAKRDYEHAIRALVEYRERRPKEIQ